MVSYYRAMLGSGIKPALAEPAAPLLYLHGDEDGAMDPRFFPVVEHWVPPARAPRSSEAPGTSSSSSGPTEVAAEILAFVS